jgi:hypothetical protein
MPYKIYISRELIVPPIADPEKRRMVLDIIADNANEWTHFTHVHHKHIAQYVLLYKREHREIFHYKSRRLYPLPFFDDFIVFRDYRPEQMGYKNIYYHIKSGRMNYLNSYTKEKPDGSVELSGEFVFELPFYWKFAPWFFFWAFKKRMGGLIKEDNVLIKERIQMKGFDTKPCRPLIPESYDMFDAFYGDTLPAADSRFLDRTLYPDLEEA